MVVRDALDGLEADALEVIADEDTADDEGRPERNARAGVDSRGWGSSRQSSRPAWVRRSGG